MFKLKKAIEKYLDVKLKELRLKDKKEMTPEELQLINSIEEMERNKRKWKIMKQPIFYKKI